LRTSLSPQIATSLKIAAAVIPPLVAVIPPSVATVIPPSAAAVIPPSAEIKEEDDIQEQDTYKDLLVKREWAEGIGYKWPPLAQGYADRPP